VASGWRHAGAGALALMAMSAMLLTIAGTASAFDKAMWGPAIYDGQPQFPIYQDLGVDLWQTGVNWHDVAPTRPADPTNPDDPAYHWPAELDAGAAQATQYGIDVLVMPMYTPGWANGDGPPQRRPTDPQDYTSFLVAIAKRYPSVRRFMIWGEPIRGTNYELHPTDHRNYYVKTGNTPGKLKPFNAQQQRDDRGYAELVDAAYARLKGIDRSYVIIGGNTTTSGDVDPFNWARYLKLANGKPPRMDQFGHNPFGTRGPDLAKPQLLAGTADLSDLDVFAPWVKRYVSRGGRNHKLKLFLSEYTAPTDVANYEFPYHVTRQLQASWLTAAFRIAHRLPMVSGLGWISLRDQPVRDDGSESRTGLIDAQGNKKPAYGAFKRG
jgi:hypothetical protein